MEEFREKLFLFCTRQSYYYLTSVAQFTLSEANVHSCAFLSLIIKSQIGLQVLIFFKAPSTDPSAACTEATKYQDDKQEVAALVKNFKLLEF